jgi:Acetyltransferases, including N-acetylases of ribosomal proteins
MYIKTERLVIRSLEPYDAAGLLKIKNDPGVMKYIPDFIDNGAGITEAENAIAHNISLLGSGDFSAERYYAIELDGAGMIGVITSSKLGYLREIQMGWMVLSEYTGKGYASEAARAASDYIMRTYELAYVVVVMDVDNPASFQTALKSGFKLFEKRVPFDYYYSDCDPRDFAAVTEHFSRKQAEVGSCYYYFRKYNPDMDIKEKFYGDTVYTGRFA